jgi:hypothetical protein
MGLGICALIVAIIALTWAIRSNIAYAKKNNSRFTSKQTIVNQMNEHRPLPLGRAEFEEWSDRIIAGAMIPGATVASQKWTLANMLLHLGPSESHKDDAHFIHGLRKFAVNQVADALRTEIRDSEKARLAKEAEDAKLHLVPLPPEPKLDVAAGSPFPDAPPTNETKVLADTGLQGT